MAAAQMLYLLLVAVIEVRTVKFFRLLANICVFFSLFVFVVCLVVVLYRVPDPKGGLPKGGSSRKVKS